MRNRLLIVGKRGSGQLQLLEKLAGSLPPNVDGQNSETSHAGLSHLYHIDTKYYSADLTVWIDEFDSSSLQNWVETFSSAEAAEVREVLAGVILCISADDDEWKEEVQAVGKFVDLLEQELWDGVSIVFMDEKSVIEREGEIFECGMEAVSDSERVREAIESNSYGLSASAASDSGNASGRGDLDALESEIKSQLTTLMEGSEKQVQDMEEILEQLRAAKSIDDEAARYAICEKLADKLMEFD